MGGSFIIYISLIMAYVFFTFSIAPLELNLSISKLNLSNQLVIDSKKFVDFKNSATSVNLKDIQVYDETTKAALTVNGIVFSLNTNDDLFIPNKTNLGKYLIINNKGNIQKTDNSFLYYPESGIIGSFFYSGSTATGNIINAIDQSIYCSFKSSTSTCN